jgi:ketosteroid isomerase-like protein
VSEPIPEVLIRDGLAAWARGDLDSVELLLDPAVTLKAPQPGPWDCDNREQVMSLLRGRQGRQSRGETSTVEVLRIDDAMFAVSSLGGGEDVATLVTIGDGKVISLQQFSNIKPDPDAEMAVAAIRSGDGDALAAVLATHPDLARARIPGYQSRTLLHIATDWPATCPAARRSFACSSSAALPERSRRERRRRDSPALGGQQRRR